MVAGRFAHLAPFGGDVAVSPAIRPPSERGSPVRTGRHDHGFGADTSAIASAKQALRDAPAASAIDAATDMAGLKAAWDASLLGDSPY